MSSPSVEQQEQQEVQHTDALFCQELKAASVACQHVLGVRACLQRKSFPVALAVL